MKVLVTGSTGHLGEALMRTLPALGHDPVGLDILASPFTRHAGSILDRQLVRRCLSGVDAILHTATLHKPHVATHSKQAFIDVNITGTLTLLEEAVAAGIGIFVFTSTTSAFGAALTPPPGQPAAWIDENVSSVPKNIYGVTKTAAEDLCELFARTQGLNVIILRTSRFFPEPDDSRAVRETFSDTNTKANEFLFRRVDLEDVVTAHAAALSRAADIGFGEYIVSAPSPFTRDDLTHLRRDPEGIVADRYPAFREVYALRGFRMFPDISRVYVSARARDELGWRPRFDFGAILGQLRHGTGLGSDLARQVGIKGYHAEAFEDGPYPVE